MEGSSVKDRRVLRQSGIWQPETIEDIQAKSELGRYRIRGFSAPAHAAHAHLR